VSGLFHEAREIETAACSTKEFERERMELDHE
jgi:hypothetical protein